VQSIRRGCELQRRLAPVATRLGELGSRRERWTKALALRDGAREARAALVARRGEREVLEGERSSIRDELARLGREKKAVDALRSLLSDSLAVLGPQPPRDCPVCEQRLPPALDLPGRLRIRVGAVTSRELEELEAKERAGQARVAEVEKALAEHLRLEAELERAQQELERQRVAAVEALGGAGIAEGKVAPRLAEVVAELEREAAAIRSGLEAMEGELGAIALRERSLTTALLAVIRKREELERHELAAKALAAAHARDEERAQAMAARARQLEAIRRALLEAKQGLAGDSLAKAGPRAQELYRALVRHPLFDALAIQATPKANKVDYAFQVSRAGAAGSAREARLVLSDGQLTATALALFFGLAESSAHGLDLLYVDDPTQNLDLRSKEAMAKVVTRLAETRQVVVSTQDEDFVSFLDAAGFCRAAAVHRFTGWDGDPRVETRAP
jgi:predicted ATPase